MELSPMIGGPRSMSLVSVGLELVNADHKEVLETVIADRLLLIDTEGYSHELQPDTYRYSPQWGEPVTLSPGMSIEGKAIFHVPQVSQPAQIAYITNSGPLLVDLVAGAPAAAAPAAMAASDMQGPIRFDVYGMRQLGYNQGIVLDVGLYLVAEDLLVLPIEDMDSLFELHDQRGRFYQAGGDRDDILRPLQSQTLHRSVVTRGELLFFDAPSSGRYSLVLNYENSQVGALLPLVRAQVNESSPYRQTGAGATGAIPAQRDLPAGSSTPAKSGYTEGSVSLDSRAVDYPAEIQGIPTVLNTALLEIDGRLVTLHGVRGANQPYVDQLSDFLGDRTVNCKRVRVQVYRCVTEERDLSEAVISNGAGWAADDAAEELLEAQETARENGRGVWQ